MNKIDRIKVITKFPGFEIGDVLVLDSSTGFFVFSYNESEEVNGTEAITDYLAEDKPKLTKKEVLDNFGYFENITQYVMKDPEEVRRRIESLRGYLNAYKNKGSMEGGKEDERKKAMTVWQNLIYELEWVLGKRSIL